MEHRRIFLIRSVRGLVSLYFLACIAVTHRHCLWSSLAVLSILIEGWVVYLYHGNCPLG